MSIISNYENLNPNYHPNNMSSRQCVGRLPYQHTLPYKDYNFSGDFDGFSWNYKDSLSLTFDINPIITVESDALIYTQIDTGPTVETVGKFGQRAYNTQDLKCWVCKTFDQNTNVWELEDEFTYPTNILDGQKIRLQVYKNINSYSGKLRILNFRWEGIVSFDVSGGNSITVNISPEISLKLVKGIYYGEIDLDNGNNSLIKLYTSPLIVK